MKQLFSGLILGMGLLLAGCSGGGDASNVEMQDEASRTAEFFVNAVNAGDYDSAFTACHKDFFESRDEEQWIEYFKSIQAVLGKRTGTRLKQKISDSRLSGAFHRYEYSSQFENGLGKEIVTLVQKINTDEPPRVFAYKIESSKIPEARD